jgi:hypothetical protein
MMRPTLAIALVALLALAGCRLGPGSSASGSAAASGIQGTRLGGTVVAGPTCPVVTEPPQSGCADRPVAGAVLVVIDGTGKQVRSVTSAADGSFTIELTPGRYRLVPQPLPGLMGTAPEQTVTLDASAQEVTVTYDTGIR